MIDVVIIGLGSAGVNLHLPALRRLRGVRVIAAADPDERKHPAATGLKVFTDWRELLGLGAQAAIVATPSQTHAEVAGALLDAGLHVYLEKPLATTLEDAVALGPKVEQSGCVFRLGYAYRFHPLWRRVKALVDSGAFMPPFTADGRFAGSREGTGWEAPLLNLSLHHVDLISWLLGVPPEWAEVAGVKLSTGWTDGTTLSGEYEVGPRCDKLRLAGGEDFVEVDRLAGTRLRASGIRLGRAGLIDPQLVRAHLTSSGWERSFELALGSFFGAVEGGGRGDGPSYREGLAMVATGEAISASMQSGVRQPVRPT